MYMYIKLDFTKNSIRSIYSNLVAYVNTVGSKVNGHYMYGRLGSGVARGLRVSRLEHPLLFLD